MKASLNLKKKRQKHVSWSDDQSVRKQFLVIVIYLNLQNLQNKSFFEFVTARLAPEFPDPEGLLTACWKQGWADQIAMETNFLHLKHSSMEVPGALAH